MFVRRMSEEEWLDGCWKEIANLSVNAGISVQDARDGAVLRDKLVAAIYPPSAEVIDFPLKAAR